MIKPCINCGKLCDVQYGPGLCTVCRPRQNIAPDPPAEETETEPDREPTGPCDLEPDPAPDLVPERFPLNPN